MKRTAIASLFILIASPAWADLRVIFEEGAPKDRFSIVNVSRCDLGAARVTIDLEGSPYGLIFDTTGRGAGVEVFQPFELVSGGDQIHSLPKVMDGDTQITLALTGVGAGQTLAFTIDVDDTKTDQEIIVSDGEITGAMVSVEQPSGTTTASFSNQAIASVKLASCIS